RLDKAKVEIAKLINKMETGHTAMIVSFADQARVEQSFTDSRSRLRMKLNQIKLTNHTTDLEEALRTAAGLANPGSSGESAAEARAATMYIYSDGGFAPTEFSLGTLTPVYRAMGETTTPNVAIGAFSVSRNPEKPGKMKVFARAENYGTDEVTTNAALYIDDSLVDADEISIPPDGGITGISFTLEDRDEGILRMVLEHKDTLPTDNTAYAVLARTRIARVLLITAGNPFLEKALTTKQSAKISDITVLSPSVLKTESYKNEAMAGMYDVIIYDRVAPDRMPRSNTYFIGTVPPKGDWELEPKKLRPFILDVDRVHPITQFVNMTNVVIIDGSPVKSPRGSTVLMDAQIGPVIVSSPREGFVDVVQGFELGGVLEDGAQEWNTDWPRHRSFPVYCYNVLSFLGGQSTADATRSSEQPGASLALRTILPVEYVTVTSPSGKKVKVEREGEAAYRYVNTEELGVYSVTESTSELPSQYFAINIFDSRESDIRAAEKVDLGYEEIEGSSVEEPGKKDIWKWIIGLAIIVLVFEWYVYNRRVYL
ncbi:MAG: hypothetical protein ACI9G1_004098, partial [Pirellulaceae bacterium]